MPYHLFSLPVSATALSVRKDGETYPLLLDTDTFDRAGEDGDIPILPVCGGDEFVGESLEGQWHKGWDSDIATFTATIDSGTLRLTGVAAIAGTNSDGYINNHHPAPMVDELEVTWSMEVPVDDTGTTASRDIIFDFWLKQDKDEIGADSDNNSLLWRINVDETGLILQIWKTVNGAQTLLDSGFDYTMDGTRDTGDLEACIWRVVFNGKPGTDGATMSIYLKQSDTIANAESETENELAGSPYDISDLAFNIGYPSYRIRTQNTTYFGTTYDSADRAESTYLRLNYPSQFNVNYDWAEADYGEGSVELWDGDPDSGGVQVFDEDHEFSNHPYIQNGLIRIHFELLTSQGVDIYYWNGASYVEIQDQFTPFLPNITDSVNFPKLLSVVYLSPEQIILNIRLLNTATDDQDVFIDGLFTLKRGSYYFEYDPRTIYPVGDMRLIWTATSKLRFGYVGDGEVGDDDPPVNESGVNTTMTDNFLVAFDDDGVAVLVIMGTNYEPTAGTTQFEADDGGNIRIRDTDDPDLLKTVFYCALVPFSLVTNLFAEAEDDPPCTTNGDIEDPDNNASNLKSVKLDGVNEFVYYSFNAGTNLPAGDYLAVFRIRDTNQVEDDILIRVTNNDLTEYRNEEGTNVFLTATNTYAYYSIFFQITDTDVAGTDEFWVLALKVLADANDVFVDYILIVPIGDGMNFPQDLAHSALRGVTQHPRLCER